MPEIHSISYLLLFSVINFQSNSSLVLGCGLVWPWSLVPVSTPSCLKPLFLTANSITFSAARIQPNQPTDPLGCHSISLFSYGGLAVVLESVFYCGLFPRHDWWCSFEEGRQASLRSCCSFSCRTCWCLRFILVFPWNFGRRICGWLIFHQFCGRISHGRWW